MTSIITLTTDFGQRDSYVAEMKGVLVSNSPSSTIVDVSHDVPICNVLHGARLLAQAVRQFPSNSIHVGVVDPGVGSRRRRIVLNAKLEQGPVFLIGPDNGLFSIILGTAELLGAWRIEEIPKGMSRGNSTTFDGRDVFAPAAALIANGTEPTEFCSEIELSNAPLVQLQIPDPQLRTDGSLQGEIVSFDHFGNALTNIHREALGENYRSYRGMVGNHEVAWVTHYAEIPPNSIGLLFNSQGYVEIAAREQSAKDLLQLSSGTSCQLLLS